MTDRIDKAVTRLEQLGYQPWPARSDSKAPARDGWRNHDGWTPPDDLTYNGAYGILTGERSGNLEMIELEGRAVNDGTAEDFFDAIEAAGLGDIWSEIECGMQTFSPSGGAHYYFKVDGENAGNTKLAFNEDSECLIETRGEGGFVVGPGSQTADGREWILTAGCDPAKVPTITVEQRDAIFDAARKLDKRPVRPESPQTTLSAALASAEPSEAGSDLRDYVVAEIGVCELLEADGWEMVGGNGKGGVLLTRPGKDDEGASAELHEDGVLTVYSTTVQGQPNWARALVDGPYPWASPIGVLAALRFDGHIDQAQSWVRSKITQANAEAEPGDTATDLDEIPNYQNGWIQGDDPWAILDAIDAGTYEPLDPTIGTLQGSDTGLFYEGEVNALYGEPGAGKTWLALSVAMEEIRKGRRVLVADYEASARVTMLRMHRLGLRPEHRDLFDYRSVAGAPLADAPLFLDGQYDLLIIDSTGEAMGAEPGDMSSYNDGDVAKWFQALKVMTRRIGDPTVILLDHVVKSKDDRGRFAIGSQRKLAAITGVAFGVAGNMGKRGETGRLELRVSKDRHGAFMVGSQAATVLVVDNGDQLTMEAHRPVKDDEIEDALGPAAEADPDLCQQILDYIIAHRIDGQPTAVVELKDIKNDIPAKNARIIEGVNALLEADRIIEAPSAARSNGKAYQLAWGDDGIL